MSRVAPAGLVVEGGLLGDEVHGVAHRGHGAAHRHLHTQGKGEDDASDNGTRHPFSVSEQDASDKGTRHPFSVFKSTHKGKGKMTRQTKEQGPFFCF
jgi:hypothetical protein